MTSLSILKNYKEVGYNLILVIVNKRIKIIHSKSVSMIINIARLTKIIIDIIVRPNSFRDSIVNTISILFTS